MLRLAPYMLRLVLAAVLLISAGCATTSTSHQDNVNAANQRWRQLRTRLLLQTAQRQFDTGDLEQAQKTVKEALAMDPTEPRLHVLAGRIMLERGQLEQAQAFFRTAIQLQPILPEAHYYCGLVYQRWQQFDSALIEYQNAWQLRPDHPPYLLAKCEMLVALDRSDEALAELTENLSRFDQNAALRLAVGHIYAMRNDYAHAVDFFHQASLLRPDDLSILEQLALAQLAAGQTRQAIENLERLAASPENTDRPEICRFLARAYEAAGQSDRARNVYLQLIRRNPDDAVSWLRLMELSWALSDTPGAAAAAQRVLQLDPERYQAHLVLGLIAQSQGQWQTALDRFQQAARLAPDLAEPLILSGLALEQLGRPDQAAQCYRQALERQPDDPRLRQLLVRLAPSLSQADQP